MSKSFELHARTVTLLTLVSRVTGLLRDAVLSRVFGAGALMDAFFFAFLIPNLFRRLFGEGALSAAFLPTYAQLHDRDETAARQLASLTIASVTLALSVVVLLGEIALLLLSARADHANLAIWLTMIMLPYMPMVCIVALLGAMLQVHHRFGPTAASPIVLNLCIVAASLAGGWFVASVLRVPVESREFSHVGVVAASVLVGGGIQVAWSLIALRRHQWWRRDMRSAREHFRLVLVQAGPMILGLGVLQINTLLDGVIACYPTTFGDTIFGVQYPLAEGAMANISYAQRLYQFPLGVFGIAVATAIFPQLARLAGDHEAFANVLRRGLRLVVFIGLPASAGLMLVRQPLTAVILQGGEFSADDTRSVGFVLLGYAPAIWAYSMVHVLTRAFYARGDSKTPVKVALAVVALNLAGNCTLIWTPLREAGLAWSTALCSLVQVSLLLWLLRRRMEFHLSADVARSWAKSFVVAVAMALLVAATLYALPGAETWRQTSFTLVCAVAVGLLAVVVLARALHMPELAWALGRTVNDNPRRSS